MVASGIETYFLIFEDSKSRNRNGRLDSDLRGGLRHGRVPNMADLAVLFVRRVLVPVPCCLHGKQAHGKD